jgi:hypothetical protein
MTGPSAVRGDGKAIGEVSRVEASGPSGGGGVSPNPQAPAAAAGSEDSVSEMMGWLCLTAAETTTVVLDEGTEAIPVHSKWTIVGKVLSPTNLHISTISSALRPAWATRVGFL